MPRELVDAMREAGHEVVISEELSSSISHVDIAYSTRIQEERFQTKAEADLYRGRFRLNQLIYTQFCEPNTVIMHPLPRDSRLEANELDNDLNQNPNLAIFRQADNGILVRMAFFALVLDVVEPGLDLFEQGLNGGLVGVDGPGADPVLLQQIVQGAPAVGLDIQPDA